MTERGAASTRRPVAAALMALGIGVALVGAWLVPPLAVVLVVIGGGLGWIRLIADVAAGLGDPISLVTHYSYDNAWLTEWPYFRIPSVMGTGLLVLRCTRNEHRHGYPAGPHGHRASVEQRRVTARAGARGNQLRPDQ